MVKKKRKKQLEKDAPQKRAPIVAVMGHIDHGKSTLLDYIRKEKVTETEAGGITQHVSAYEVITQNEKGEEETITFIDTPGHEAFSAARARGATVADIAILVVAADDGVNTQTLEALEALKETSTPFVVAITKIDKDSANVEVAKSSLVENGVYIEGYGGDISYAEVSSKTGAGVDELLETILLVAEIEELTGDPSVLAEGIVLESSIDPQKGTSATLLIKNGTLNKSTFVVSEDTFSPVRILENFQGEPLMEATFSQPVKLIGFNKLPNAGAPFITVAKKKEAEKIVSEFSQELPKEPKKTTEEILKKMTATEKALVPILIKTDAVGSQDGVIHEIKKLGEKYENVDIEIISTGVGDISENDIRLASGSEDTIIVGFHVGLATRVPELAERNNTTLETFNIIYKMSEWIESEVEKRKPRVEIEESIAKAKIKRVFSNTKNAYVAGGKVQEGTLEAKAQVKIFRRDAEIGRGKVLELQQGKVRADKVEEGLEFGIRIETKTEVNSGDTIEVFVVREG